MQYIYIYSFGPQGLELHRPYGFHLSKLESAFPLLVLMNFFCMKQPTFNSWNPVLRLHRPWDLCLYISQWCCTTNIVEFKFLSNLLNFLLLDPLLHLYKPESSLTRKHSYKVSFYFEEQICIRRLKCLITTKSELLMTDS